MVSRGRRVSTCTKATRLQSDSHGESRSRVFSRKWELAARCLAEVNSVTAASLIGLCIFASVVAPLLALSLVQAQYDDNYVVPVMGTVRKICQLVGDFDRERNELDES
jgi:multisubunit Na+/H+ antiporter MnhG subunit